MIGWKIHNFKGNNPKTMKYLQKIWCVVMNHIHMLYISAKAGFFPGGTGGLPSGENFVNPPIRHLSPFLDKVCPPPSRGSSPKI